MARRGGRGSSAIEPADGGSGSRTARSQSAVGVDGAAQLLSGNTVAERVADQLRSEIQRAVLPPGTRLLQTEIAERFGVSTTPVREALSTLQGEGLIVIDRHRGAVVFQPTIEDFRECFEIRQVLEPLAVEKAIPNLTERDFDTLQRLVDEMRATRDSDRWVELNNQFHLGLYEASRFPRLCSMIASLRHASVAYLHMFAKARLETLMEGQGDRENEHQIILDACRAGDVELAVTTARKHLWRPVHDILEGATAPDLSIVDELLRKSDTSYNISGGGDGD